MNESIKSELCPKCEEAPLRLWSTYRYDTLIEEILQCQNCKTYWRRIFSIKDGKIEVTQERFFFG